MGTKHADSLSDTQKRILRFVLLHHSSKEIAKLLDCSPHTVDNHIKAAIGRLGAKDRYDAARMVATVETDPERRALASQPSALERPLESSNALISPTHGENQSSEASHPPDTNSVLKRDTDSTRGGYRLLPLPRYWGEENDLKFGQKLFRIACLTVALSLSFGALISSLQALQHALVR